MFYCQFFYWKGGRELNSLCLILHLYGLTAWVTVSWGSTAQKATLMYMNDYDAEYYNTGCWLKSDNRVSVCLKCLHKYAAVTTVGCMEVTPPFKDTYLHWKHVIWVKKKSTEHCKLALLCWFVFNTVLLLVMFRSCCSILTSVLGKAIIVFAFTRKSGNGLYYTPSLVYR